MNKILIWSCFLLLFIVVSETAYAQKNRSEPAGKNDIGTPKKRRKSRTKDESEHKVSVKKNRNYIRKRSNGKEYKVNVSPRSNNVPIVVDNSKSETVKKKKPLRQLKKSQKNAEKVADSDGPIGGKPEPYRRKPGTVYKEDTKGGSNYNSKSEEGAYTTKTKSEKKKRKERENQENKVSGSDGPVAVEPEPYRRRPGSIYKDDPKGGSKYKPQSESGAYTTKTRSEERKKKDREKQENKVADSDGPIGNKPEPYRRRPGTIYKEDQKGGSKYKSQGESGAYTYKTKSQKRKRKDREKQEERIADSDGPIGMKPEPYRKRPGTIYREDQKGGSKYKSQGEKGAYTYKSMTPEKKEKKLARRSKEQGLFEGDLKLAKRTKEMHPSSAYLDARKSKSIEEKQNSRKKELRKSKGRNSGQPKIVTEKRKKPKYDSRESEIWNN